ncbi:MAG: DUF3153 domain-containing protein [Clostridia bacterium]
MKKRIGLIIMLIVILVALTGCVNVDYEVEVNKNGSGEISYIYGFSKETLNNLQVSAEDMVESMKEQAEENSYTVEAYENDEISGFKAKKHIEDLTKDFSLQEAFGEEYVKDKENNGIKIEEGLFVTKYSQNAEIDLTSMGDLSGNVKMTYKVKLPAKAKTNNATEVSKNSKELKWELTAGEINKVEFVAQGINVLAIIITVIIIAVLVTGITMLLIFLKKKHATKKEN